MWIVVGRQPGLGRVEVYFGTQMGRAFSSERIARLAVERLERFDPTTHWQVRYLASLPSDNEKSPR